MPSAVRRYLAFGLNVGNLGRAFGKRIRMRNWVSEINRYLEKDGSDIRVVTSFGHTGNLVVDAEESVAGIRSQLSAAAGGTDFVVLTVAAVERLNGVFDRVGHAVENVSLHRHQRVRADRQQAGQGGWGALATLAPAIPTPSCTRMRGRCVLCLAEDVQSISGSPQAVAMQMSGHKTDNVFRRYDIVSEADLADATRRLDDAAGKVSGKVPASR